MKRLIIYVLVLVLAVWLGLLLAADPGYILVVFKKWTIETSIWFGLILLILSFYVLYHLIYFCKILIHSRGHFIRWYKQRRFIKAHTSVGAGLLALEEGAWEEAEDLLLRGVKSSSIPVINYINAAKAAQECFEYQKRDQYLEQAMEYAQGYEKLAVSLKKARLHIDHHQYEAARISLEKLREEHSRHRYLLKMLQQVYLAENNWDKLYELLPMLIKRRVLDKSDLEKLSSTIYQNLFASPVINLEKLNSYWKMMPKELRSQQDVLLPYLKALKNLHADSQAESLIVDTLKKHYSTELVNLLGQLSLKNYGTAIKQLESLSKQYGERPEILTVLASFALNNHDTASAKNYIDRALLLNESSENFYLLFKIYEQMDDEPQALEALKKYAKIASKQSEVY